MTNNDRSQPAPSGPSVPIGDATPSTPLSEVIITIRNSIDTLSRANTSDVQKIAGSQLKLLNAYHSIALSQSRRSFFWAMIGAGVGLLFFVCAIAFTLLTSTSAVALIPLLSGAILEVVAGVVFFLYGKAAAQLSSFHGSLQTLQRYLLANSICESLEGEDRAKARFLLIQEMSRSDAPCATG